MTPLALGQSPLQRILHDPYKPQYILAFVEPAPEPIKVRDESHSAYINFKVDKYEILEQYKNNATELASILNSIDKVKQDEDLTITSITIEGWASPEATQAHNQRLSQNRANSLSDYVSAKTGIERSRIEAIGRGEDWKGLREAVVATPRLLDQKKVLDIIDRTDLSLDQKDKILSELVPPTIYQRLMNEMYPKLRRNDYRIVYNVRNFNIEEARALIDTDPRKLSLSEMYKVAGSYQKGSKEYNHVMEVAAKTYPTQTAAAVNAAAVMIGKGDSNAALAILSKADQNDKNVLLTTGYAYAKMGNNDKARDCWQKAADKGSAEAKHNIAELAKSLE
jgi:tetratricopeptide (TPR) repeat protein